MRVLQVGQLPKEMGGFYTTGVARVVGELSKRNFGAHETFLYATNMPNEKAQALSKYKHQYMGYRKRPLHMLFHILMHPRIAIDAYKTYRITETASFLHMEFIRDNFNMVINLVKPDVIHFHGTAFSAMHFANVKMNVPIIYSPHAMVGMDENKEVNCNDSYIRAVHLLLTFPDYYTALNDSVIKRLLSHGIDKDKVYVVPNGVDSTKFYYSETARNELRKAMGVTDGTFVFISVGLVVDRKGQFDFLKILQTLGIDYQYWIIGNGPDYDKIVEYTKTEGLESKVKLLGYVQDTEIYKYHSAADFYAHASYFEAQALSEIEAYSCGLRIIVNKVIADTVIGDVVVEKDNYYVADFNDVCKEDLIAWIKRPTGERKSKKQFDWQTIANAYAKVYELAVK